MRLQIFTLALMALMPSGIYANDYFVSPEGKGLKDGSSWDNALAFADFYANVNGYQTGDNFYFAGGTYRAVSATPTAIINGYNFVGGFDPQLTGTEHRMPSYPSATPTVFSGDVDGNGVKDATDASRFLAIKTDTKKGGTDQKPFLIQGIDFTDCYDATSTKTHGAVHLNNSYDVTISHCHFYNNSTDQAGYGGMALTSYRSTVFVRDCDFTNNTAVQRGGAVYVWVDGTDYTKGYTVFERCHFANNSVTDTTSPLGSAIFYSHGPALYLVNCNVVNNTAPAGGAIYVNGADRYWRRELYLISSTIAGNDGGNQINMSQGARLFMVNTIVVGREDNGLTDKAAIAVTGSTESSEFAIVSKGHNILGSYANAVSNAVSQPTYDATDVTGQGNNYAAVFENNVVSERTLVPSMKIKGYDAETLISATTDYALDGARVNASIDILGQQRTSASTPGAVAVDVNTLGIHQINEKSTNGNEYYTLSGVKVSKPTTKGVYIHNGRLVVIY